jgi:protein ImuB
MLWIALHPPALSLQAFAATFGAARLALPLALLDGARIAAANAVAAQLGVAPGLKRATALALAPQLLLGQADAARDAQALRALAHAALAFTPMVTLDAGAGLPCVLLEVRASLRCFGGPAALQQRLRAALAPLGFELRLAGAPTALGAALLAQGAAAGREDLAVGPHITDLAALRRRLDEVPVWRLGPGREHGEALQGMGLRTLADLRALPRTGLARRFGEELLTELDRARGDAPDPREPVRLPSSFESRLELFARADSAEQVLHAAAVLLQHLIAWAGAIQARVARFTLEMRHERRHRADEADPASTRLVVALAEASNDAAHLQLLLRERLARVELPAPTLELRLHCRDIVRQAAPNGELFPTRASECEGLLRLLERLQARLGPAQVRRLQRVADHRPERATAYASVLAPAVAAAPAVPDAPHLTRPVWLLPEPQPLAEQRLQPLLDGRALQLLAGPERIESGWWDGGLVARDYFVALAHDGSLVWIYRRRLPQAADDGTPPGAWFLHGRFA